MEGFYEIVGFVTCILVMLGVYLAGFGVTCTAFARYFELKKTDPSVRCLRGIVAGLLWPIVWPIIGMALVADLMGRVLNAVCGRLFQIGRWIGERMAQL